MRLYYSIHRHWRYYVRFICGKSRVIYGVCKDDDRQSLRLKGSQGEAQSQEQRTGGCYTATKLGHFHKAPSLQRYRANSAVTRGRDAKTLASSPRLLEQAPAIRVLNTVAPFLSTEPLVSKGARFLRLYTWYKFFERQMRPGLVDLLDAKLAKSSSQSRLRSLILRTRAGRPYVPIRRRCKYVPCRACECMAGQTVLGVRNVRIAQVLLVARGTVNGVMRPSPQPAVSFGFDYSKNVKITGRMRLFRGPGKMTK